MEPTTLLALRAELQIFHGTIPEGSSDCLHHRDFCGASYTAGNGLPRICFLATCVPTSSSKRDLPSHMSEPDRVSNVLTCIGGSNLCLNLASEGSQHWRRDRGLL